MACVTGKISAQEVLCYSNSDTCSNETVQPIVLTSEACCFGNGHSFSDIDGETCLVCIGRCIILLLFTIIRHVYVYNYNNYNHLLLLSFWIQ